MRIVLLRRPSGLDTRKSHERGITLPRIHQQAQFRLTYFGPMIGATIGAEHVERGTGKEAALSIPSRATTVGSLDRRMGNPVQLLLSSQMWVSTLFLLLSLPLGVF